MMDSEQLPVTFGRPKKAVHGMACPICLWTTEHIFPIAVEEAFWPDTPFILCPNPSLRRGEGDIAWEIGDCRLWHFFFSPILLVLISKVSAFFCLYSSGCVGCRGNPCSECGPVHCSSQNPYPSLFFTLALLWLEG